MKNLKKIISVAFITLLLNGCYGFAPSPWSNAGFKSIRAKNFNDRWSVWHDAGFTPQEAKEWHKKGFKAINAKYWKRDNFTLEEALYFKKNNYNNSRELKALNLSLNDLKVYIDKLGTNVFIIKTYLKAGVTPQELKDGFPPKYDTWFNKGLTKEDVKNWGEITKHIKYKYAYVKELKKKNIKPKIFKQYNQILSPSYAIKAIEENISIKRLKAVKDILTKKDIPDFGENNMNTMADFMNLVVQQMKQKDLSFKILKFAQSNIKINHIPNYYYTPGYILLNKKKMDKVQGACNYIQGKRLSKFSPFATTGKCFKYEGKVTTIRDNQTVEIKECVKTDNRFDDCLKGRVSLLIFNKHIPETMHRGSRYYGVVKSLKPIKTFLYGNSSKNTELLSAIADN
jgi:hypothetical protein